MEAAIGSLIPVQSAQSSMGKRWSGFPPHCVHIMRRVSSCLSRRVSIFSKRTSIFSNRGSIHFSATSIDASKHSCSAVASLSMARF